ncbi:cation:proton antiporter [Celeribacter indicus]|uniref:Na(+):H(+) antiporter n=1 Tax=Celeribacter indicus TaxID=1208324 RepID=A0A0B5DWH2_9RHOB|nr:sodium:proton antiporter [Celeribacter indicus]AJE47404.1 Na(+):H(+) antiporter [Celeribacter indicus]SDW05715.1 sodium/proton antiporter, CPA1 family [Celeribacter indicus]
MATNIMGGLAPVEAFALIGVLGVGSQWLAWRLKLPAIVLMLVAGILIGPVTGILDPDRDIGELVQPLISLAVAVILFEGGLTLDLHKLGDARTGVTRLVVIGAPLGWFLSALALHFGAGIGWEASAVFGGIMVVTGPTVIAPLLRQAKLQRRPANLLQWEAIVNDPVGALAAVLAFEFVLVGREAESLPAALLQLGFGIAIATGIGLAAGAAVSYTFRRGYVPEYMKVPVLFAALLATFAVPDLLLHESGLLAVTVMGLVIANADLPSFEELRRFKEHATILLVSGVFILLASSVDFATLAQLTWRAGLFVLLVIAVARPLTVLISLIGTGLPWKEKLFLALTGPRGVVLVAVAGLFGERLAAAGVPDGVLLGPLAFVLVIATVTLHGFTLAPMARFLGLASTGRPGVLFVGGSRFTTALAAALKKEEVPVLISDPNHGRLVRPRAEGLPIFYGDVLSEAAEDNLELLDFSIVIAATENDAYNTLVTTDLAPEFGREHVWQLARVRENQSRHALPTQLGGRGFGAGKTYRELDDLMRAGWRISVTPLTEEYGFDQWKADREGAHLLGRLSEAGEFKRLLAEDAEILFPKRAEAAIEALPEDQRESAREGLKRRMTEARLQAARGRMAPGVRLVALVPPEPAKEKPKPSASRREAARLAAGDGSGTATGGSAGQDRGVDAPNGRGKPTP